MVDKKKLLEKGVTSDKHLSKEEKETTITFPNDLDYGIFHSDVPTTIKWFLSVKETEVVDYKENDSGEIVRVKGKIPKGIVKLQSNSRSSHSHSHMVSYGPNRE